MSLSLRNEEARERSDADCGHCLYTPSRLTSSQTPRIRTLPPAIRNAHLLPATFSRALDGHLDRVNECQMPPPSALTTANSVDIPCAMQQRRSPDASKRDNQTSPSNTKDL